MRLFVRHRALASPVLGLPSALILLAASTLAVQPAHADPQFASDKGCYNCHGTPPKKKAPTFAALAKDYAKASGRPDELQRLADKLRDGSIFSHVDAHERLSEEDALRLVRWIAEGAL